MFVTKRRTSFASWVCFTLHHISDITSTCYRKAWQLHVMKEDQSSLLRSPNLRLSSKTFVDLETWLRHSISFSQIHVSQLSS